MKGLFDVAAFACGFYAFKKKPLPEVNLNCVIPCESLSGSAILPARRTVHVRWQLTRWSGAKLTVCADIFLNIMSAVFCGVQLLLLAVAPPKDLDSLTSWQHKTIAVVNSAAVLLYVSLVVPLMQAVPTRMRR